MPDIRPLVKLLRKNGAKGAREWIESNKGDFNLEVESGKGYIIALQGMVSARESGGELFTLNKIINKKYSNEQIVDLIQGTRDKLAHESRPVDELGFCKAWVDVLQELVDKKNE